MQSLSCMYHNIVKLFLLIFLYTRTTYILVCIDIMNFNNGNQNEKCFFVYLLVVVVFFFNSLFILFLPKLSSSSWYFDNFIWDFDSFFEIFEIFFLSAQPTIFEGNDWVISEKWCFLNIWSEYVLNFWILDFWILDFDLFSA